VLSPRRTAAIEWRAASGRVHASPLCAATEAGGLTRPCAGLTVPPAEVDDLLPIRRDEPVRRVAGEPRLPPGRCATRRCLVILDRTLGTVVHRLLQALGTSAEHEADAVAAHALRPAAAGRDGSLADRDRFGLLAASVYLSLCRHPEVRRFYAARHPPRGAIRPGARWRRGARHDRLPGAGFTAE
jgi:hypothetical protein